MRYALTLALVAIVAAALAGCGSGSNAEDNGAEIAAVQSPLYGTGEASPSGEDYIVKSTDPIYPTKSAPRVLSYPTGRDNDEVSETGADPIAPCSLVPRDKAAAILGGSVQVTQEPQGPTCVYTTSGSEQTVTLVVENRRLASLRQHARRASSVDVAGQAGWCLRYESTSVAVPLADGRVLQVTGPCSAASRFAAQALPRVPG